MWTNLAPFVSVVVAPSLFDPATINDRKRSFAEAYAKTGDAWRAARQIETNPARFQVMALEWLQDEVVIAHIDAYQEEKGAAGLLPGKDEFALELLQLAREFKHPDTRLDYYKLYADVTGMVTKGGGANVNVAVNVEQTIANDAERFRSAIAGLVERNRTEPLLIDADAEG